MTYKIDEIEGIGAAYGAKFVAAGIANTDDLLAKCATRKGRGEVAEATGIAEGHILNFANMADLMRVKGIGKQFAELLKAAGVDTIKELRTRNAANLAAKVAEVNEARKLAKSTPVESQLQGWIDAAKEMEPLITY